MSRVDDLRHEVIHCRIALLRHLRSGRHRKIPFLIDV